MSKMIDDLTGQQFGSLTVIGMAPSDHAGLWRCLCECGNECVRKDYQLRNGSVTSCGCGCHRFKQRQKNGYKQVRKNYAGQRFGNLTGVQSGSNGEWLWKCACGNLIFAGVHDVVSGKITSCGCGTGEKTVSPEIRNASGKAHTDLTPQFDDMRKAPRPKNDSALCKIRVARGITQAQLAEMIGVGCSSVSYWETGRVKPSKESLMKLSEALKCPISEIIGLPRNFGKKSSKLIDLTGQKFGALTVIGRAPTTTGRTLWNCTCDCGRKCVQEGYALIKGIVTSCGCGMYRSSKRNGVELGVQVDYTGQTYGRLTALRRVSPGEWLWRCECGNETIAKPADVKNGNPASCGCGLKDASRKRIVDDNVLGFFDGTSVSNLRSIISGKTRSTNTSGCTGVKVRHNKSGDTYVAKIMVRGEEINLGTYSTFEDAVAARKAGEKRYFAPIIDEFERSDKNK